MCSVGLQSRCRQEDRDSASFLIHSFSRLPSTACQALFQLRGPSREQRRPFGRSQGSPAAPTVTPHGCSRGPGFPQKHRSPRLPGARRGPSCPGAPPRLTSPLLCPQGGLAAELRVPHVLGAGPRRRPAARAAAGQEGGERGPVFHGECHRLALLGTSATGTLARPSHPGGGSA